MNRSKRVETLELTLIMMGYKTLIYPTLIWDDKTVILVNAGLPTSLAKIQNGMDQIGSTIVFFRTPPENSWRF